MGQKGIKTGGRVKGTKNKKTQDLEAIAQRLGVSPFEVLLLIAKNDWEELGYDSPEVEKVSMGKVYYEDVISLESRLKAASEASQYLYPKLKSIEKTVTANIESKVVYEAEWGSGSSGGNSDDNKDS